MSMLDLLLSRQALAAGVGMTTRRNKVLPAPDLMTPIPARVGRDKPGTPEPDLCIAGDLYQPPAGAGWDTAWYVDEAKLTSTDGLFSLNKSQWKRWTGRAGSSGDVYNFESGPLVHFNFSSPAAAAVPESAAGGADLQFTEGPWSERTWHPARAAGFIYSGMLAVVQRLKTIGFRATGGLLPSAGSLLTWGLSDDDTTPTTLTDKPACINKSGDEQGLSKRVLQTTAPYSIQKFNLTIGGKQLTFKTLSPYGFLPALKETKANAYTGPYVSPPGGVYANDMLRINMIGQAVHGLCTDSGILIEGHATIPYMPTPTSCNTRYFKKPGLADPGAPTIGPYPEDFVNAGFRYYNDVVFCSGNQYAHYYATSTLLLDNSQFLHVDDAGVIRVLRVSYLSRTASTTTFRVYNDGVLTFDKMSYSTGTLLGTIVITTTSAEAIAQYTGLNTTTKVAYQSGSADVQGYSASYTSPTKKKSGYVLATSHPIAHSPNGRQIALFRGLWFRDYNIATQLYRQGVENIHTVATVDIGSDLTIGTPVDVFQWEAKYPSDRVTTYSYTYYDSTSDSEWATTTMTPYTERLCKMITYRTDGSLCLIIEEADVAASPTARNVGLRTRPYTPREAMSYPSEVETLIAMRRDIVTLKGFGADGLGSITGGVSLVGVRSNSQRLANNVVYFQNYVDGSSPATWTEHFITPLAVVARADVFAGLIVGSESRYCSYNPRTDKLGGYETPFTSGESFVRFCSWN